MYTLYVLSLTSKRLYKSFLFCVMVGIPSLIFVTRSISKSTTTKLSSSPQVPTTSPHGFTTVECPQAV